MIPLSYNIRSLMARSTSTCTAAAGISLVVFMLGGGQMIAQSMSRAMELTGSPEHAIVLRKGADTALASSLPLEEMKIAANHPAVARDAHDQPIAVGEIAMVLSLPQRATRETGNVQLRGVPQSASTFYQQVQLVEGRMFRPGSDEVIVGADLRGRFEGLDLGESFEFAGGRRATVVGVFEGGGTAFESEVWADVHSVSSAFGRDGVVSSVSVRLLPDKKEEFFRDIEGDRQLGLKAQPEMEYYARQSEGTANFVSAVSGAIVFCFSVAAALGAMVTMYGAVQQRRREIGMLRALGFGRWAVLSSIVAEATLLATVGGLVGMALLAVCSLFEFSILNTSTWTELTFSLDLNPAIILSSFILAVFVGVAGGLLPAVQASATRTVQVMRE